MTNTKPTGMTMKYEELENMIDTSGVEVSDISILMRVIEIWYNDLILQEKKALLNTITAQINAMHDDVLKDDWVSQDNLGVALDEGTQLIYDETKKELEEEL